MISMLFLMTMTFIDDKIDWQAAYKHAKASNTVRLTIFDASTPNDESFTIYLVDGEHRYAVSQVGFFVRNPASFIVSLSHVLEKLDKPPSNKAFIELKGVNNVKVTYSTFKVELPK